MVNSDIGKVSLASGPASNDELYFTYYSSPLDMTVPHALVKLACMQLTAALCFTQVDARKVHSFRVGKVSKLVQQDKAYSMYRNQYYDTINRIRGNIFKTARARDVL